MMILFRVIIVVWLFVSDNIFAAPRQSNCPAGYEPAEFWRPTKKCYQISLIRSNFSDASTYCINAAIKNGKLVTMSRYELAHITGIIVPVVVHFIG